MIYKRGNVAWYRFKWSVKQVDGTKQHYLIQRSARTRSKRKAKDVEEEHRRALRMGEIHPSDAWPKPKVPDAPRLIGFTQQLLDHVSHQRKAGTKRFYEGSLKRVNAYAPLGEARMSEISGEVISRYVQWRKAQEKGNATVTINGELRALRRAFNLAKEWGYISEMPIIHELPGAAGRDRVVSHQEEAVYLRHAGGTLHDVTVLAADTGARPDSELFPLEWSNVHLETTIEAPYGHLHVSQGKTDNSPRNVPLTPRCSAILSARRDATGVGKGKYVFPGQGRSGHLTTIQHAHARTMRDAKVEVFEFYCWRHTFGTRAAECGMDKFALARLMGHSSPRVTERYYIHVTEPHVMAGFEKFVQYQSERTIDAHPVLSKALQ